MIWPRYRESSSLGGYGTSLPDADQIASVSSLGLQWNSPESGGQWYKSGGSKQMIWSRYEGW